MNVWRTNSGNYSLNSSINSLGTTYDLNGHDRNSITINNLQVTNLEIYKVEGSLFLIKRYRQNFIPHPTLN